MKNKIIIPTDLTPAANQAIRQASAIAGKTGSSLTLLHILDHKHGTAGDVNRSLQDQAGKIRESAGQGCEVLLKEGSIFDAIPETVCEKDYDLMVIGTHGLKGIRQSLFGANILKLVLKIPIPVLVVQEQSPLKESFNKVILPVSSHSTFQSAVDAIAMFAGIYNLEVHLYSIHKPGFPWSDQLLKNIEDATGQFEAKGIRMIRVKEEQKVFSQGYARQTLKYANSAGADAIWMISVPSKEEYYQAPTYKEAILLNEFRIPVLCTGGGTCA
jgi:nucleotide-binding universal stress UspA family protein